MTELHTEVVVVGGGPAGSVTASLIARSGHDVILLERSSFPRAKPCGESINPGAVRELAELGMLPRLDNLPKSRISGWRVYPCHGGPFEGRFPAGAPGLAIDRSVFDEQLIRHAGDSGATIATGSHVTKLLWRDDAVTGVETADGRRIHATLVVGADGLRSVIARKLRLIRRRPVIKKLALTAHVAGAELPAETGALIALSWGCIGIVRISEARANVVVVSTEETRHRFRGDSTAHFERLMREIPQLRNAALVSNVLATGPFDWPTRGVTANGALLVGDAAGYFDPFTGQGIYRAIRGARLASEVASECLRKGTAGKRDLARYEVAHRSAFAWSERLQRVIDHTLARPKLFDAISATFRTIPVLADRLVSVTGDLRPVRGLFLPHPLPPN